MGLPIGRAEWIILDTNIVRGLISREPSAIDLDALAKLKGRHPVAIADGVMAELIYWLETAPDEVVANVGPTFQRLEKVLDGEAPIATGGKELAQFAGLVPYAAGTNRRDASAFTKAIFKHACGIHTRDDLRRAITYRNSTGRGVPLVPKGPRKNESIS